MIRRPTRTKPTDTLFPYTKLLRAREESYMSKDISKAELPLSGASDPVSIVPDGDGFREAMSRAVTGVTIITTYHEGRPWGMTVSAFAPVCMKPPTLLVYLNEATVTA